MKPLITSPQNDRIKKMKQLHRKKSRVETHSFLIEGFHLIEEAFASKWNIQTVLVREGISVPSFIEEQNVLHVNERVFDSLAQTNSPQGIMAVVEMKNHSFITTPLTLIIDAVQDPGNVGTMIRSADAAGFGLVILGEGSADLYNDKVIRSTQGSLFHVPVLQMNLLEAYQILQQSGTNIVATALEGAVDYTEMVTAERMALVVGNEGAGVQQEYIDMADQIVKIPIYGQAESLNVSIAASILMYDMKRKIASLS